MKMTQAAVAALISLAAVGAQAAPVAVAGVQSATEFLLTSSNVTGGELLTSSVSGVATQPAGGTNFLAGEAGNSAVVALGGVASVSFDWGSPDSWNTLTVTESDNKTYTFTQSSLGLSGDDTYVDFTADAGLTIESLTFASAQPAFEASDFKVSAVPEPTNVALLLAGLGLMGVVARRRRI